MATVIDLARVPFQPTRYPGVSIHFYRTDRESGHAAVMIRMEPGCGYPAHRHVGPEELLVLQGGFRDEHGEWRAGDYARFEPGTRHAPVALADGPACVFFAIAHEGIDLLLRRA
ncbi:MAG: cupin domain-containing protein [Planctomycetes bacterium]|nr:cupin domain-containing protein [Planctomycetota bacterium]